MATSRKRKVAPDTGQKTLFQCEFQTNKSTESIDDSSSKTDDHVESNETRQNTEYERKFQPKWFQMYPWLEFDSAEGKMTCKICKTANKNNIFTKGTNNFRTSNITDHMKSNEHKSALIIPSLRKNLEQAEKNVANEKEKAAIIALKTVYWLAVEDVALVKFKSLVNNLLKDLQVPGIQNLTISDNVNYESSYAVLEFLEAMSEFVERETAAALKVSPYVTALADESTDISVKKRLVIYTQVVDPVSMTPSTLYLTNVEVNEGTGAAISREIFDEFEKRGVPATKIMSLGSDGASAMTGKNSLNISGFDINPQDRWTLSSEKLVRSVAGWSEWSC